MMHQRAHTEYLTASWAAAWRGIGAKTLPRAVRRGERIPTYRAPRGFVRVAPPAVAAYTRQLAVPAPPASADGVRRST